MADHDRIAGDEFLEAALGELEHLQRTRPDHVPESSIPRLVAMLERYGSRLTDPLGPPRMLHPSPYAAPRAAPDDFARRLRRLGALGQP
jgi:hypothetical protein